MTYGPRQLPVHSAHVGQDVEVFYRWHALYGRRVRLSRLEPRANGQIAYVEASPGEILIMAAWMLDPVSCAGMQMAEPRASLAALADLHRLLVACRFRRSSEDEQRFAQEDPNARLAPAPANHQPDPPVEPNTRATTAVGLVDDRPRAVRCLAGVSPGAGRRRRHGGA